MPPKIEKVSIKNKPTNKFVGYVFFFLPLFRRGSGLGVLLQKWHFNDFCGESFAASRNFYA